MKNTPLRSNLFGLSLITVCVLIASCNDFFQPPGTRDKPQTQTRSALDRKDELSLFYAYGNYETPVEELQARVNSLLQMNFDAAVQRGEAPASVSIITGVQSFSLTIENGFSLVTANKRTEETAPETSVIPFYVFQLANPSGPDGHSLACGDARIGTVISLVEQGAFDDRENPFMEVFRSCLEGYIYRTIDEWNSITDEDIALARAKLGAEESRSVPAGWDDPIACVEPLTIGTEWNQWTPYDTIIDHVAGNPPDTWPTGCVATAMAQIMAYHKWPEEPIRFIV